MLQNGGSGRVRYFSEPILKQSANGCSWHRPMLGQCRVNMAVMNNSLKDELLEIARKGFVEFCKSRPIPEVLKDRLVRSWEIDAEGLKVYISAPMSHDDMSGLVHDRPGAGIWQLVRITVDGKSRECIVNKVMNPFW